MLKLVANNSDPTHSIALYQVSESAHVNPKPSPQDLFVSDFYLCSSNLYGFRAQDHGHDLTIEMNLERKEIFAYSEEAGVEDELMPIMEGDFAAVNDHKLQESIFADDYLRHMRVTQFQLKVLKQLLLCCEDKDVTHLILNFDEYTLEYMDIYQRFVITQEDDITVSGELMQIIIPIDAVIYDNLLDFIEEIDIGFRQVLWRDQKCNPAYRDYLKGYCLLEF